MRAGISTACFYPRINTEDTIEIISKLGFDTCEVFLETEMETSREFCRELKTKADFYGIEIYSVHPFSVTFEPFLFDRYTRRRQEMENRFLNVCRAAEELKAECYVFHGLRKNPVECSIIETARNMDRLCRMAGDFGIKLAWENVSWCMSSSPDFLEKVSMNMIEKINFTLDIKQAVRSAMSPLEYLKVFGDRIINLHISDSNGEESCLLPGMGDMDLGKVMESVSDRNRNAPYIIEIYDENYSCISQIEDSRKYLEGLR